MKLTKKKIDSTMEELAELRAQADAIARRIDSLQNDLIQHMVANDMEILIGTAHKATYKLVISHRMDTTAFKADHPKLADKYTVETESMRFTFK